LLGPGRQNAKGKSMKKREPYLNRRGNPKSSETANGFHSSKAGEKGLLPLLGGKKKGGKLSLKTGQEVTLLRRVHSPFIGEQIDGKKKKGVDYFVGISLMEGKGKITVQKREAEPPRRRKLREKKSTQPYASKEGAPNREEGKEKGRSPK